MASPPFNLDTTDPADNSVVSQFPANERSFRDEVNSYVGVEHDISTGFHKFQLLTTTQRNSLSSPPTGMRIYNTTIGGEQVNIGTAGSPSWMTVGDITGAVKDFAGSTAPDGWVICDGSAISRTTFATLFGIIGTTYGAGDGSTTFNVPDCRGRVIAGFDSGNASGRLTSSATGGASANTLGNTGGEQAHTLTTAELAIHAHANSLNDSGHSHPNSGHPLTTNGPTSGNSITEGTGTTQSWSTDAASTGITITNANAGSGNAHNNVQPTIVMNKIIKS